MLRSTFYSFTTALRGMNVAQKQLDITGQNISNVGKTGYTRQRADIYSAVASGFGDRYGTKSSTMVGQGVVIGSISQCRDPFLDVRFRREAANLGEEGTKLDTMEDLSMIFDEIEKSGLMSSFSDFVSKLQSLAANAESPEFDSIVRDAANTLVKQFNQYASQINTVREEKEYNLSEVTVKKINDLMTNIAGLNKSIREVQANGGPALELKDERNLLLDELSNYMKIDVKYSPKEVAGGIVVEDVTINMVGSDGNSEPLIFNDSSAIFNVKTKGEDGTDKAIVTIDNSALPAKEAVTKINDLLKAIAIGNSTLQSINDDLAKMYPGDPTAVPPIPALTYKELGAKITEISDSITGAGGFNEQIDAANTAIETARKALSDRLADKVNPPTADEKKALEKAVNDAVKVRTDLYSKRDAAAKERDKLKDINSTATKYANGITSYDAALKNTLAAHGITATQKWTEGDYNSCFYSFTDAGGNPIVDADGNPVQWKVGSNYDKIDRDSLAAIGVVFESSFNAEELGSPGELKGALDMLNCEGIFNYNSTEVRGVGYYEKMLDSLANQLATTLNKINDKEDTPISENLFQTSDGSSTFTAENLRIAEGWLDGKYGITGTKGVAAGDNSAKNDNILLMISTISSKMTYSTGPIPNKDANGNFLKTNPDGTTSIVANGVDSDGNYTLDGVLVANKDMVNYKSIELTKVDDDNYVDGSGNVYTKTADNVFTYTDGTGKSTSVDQNGLVYKGDGTSGEYQLDAKTLSEDPATPGTYLDPDGNVVANGKDSDGNYVMITTDADGKQTSKLVANSDGVMYKTDVDGSLSKDKEGNPILDAAPSKLDYKSEKFLYKGTFQEYLANISNVLSLDISSTSNKFANHKTVIDSIQLSKDSISSVSLDEEGVNIMQFQKAYNAAARIMTALDEAVERIINQMGTVGR
ncbi:MAG: FlgK family flagellar hook-associated protein [Aminipila sp.]